MDSHCLATMLPNKDHFKDLMLKQIGECTGIGTRLTIASKGHFLMNSEDDNGGIHKIEIPNSLYVPGLWMVLLTSQHWGQQAKDTIPDSMGTFIGIKRCSRKLSHLMTSPTFHLSMWHWEALIIEPLPQHLKPCRHIMSLERKPSYCQI